MVEAVQRDAIRSATEDNDRHEEIFRNYIHRFSKRQDVTCLDGQSFSLGNMAWAQNDDRENTYNNEQAGVIECQVSHELANLLTADSKECAFPGVSSSPARDRHLLDVDAENVSLCHRC